MPSTVRPNRTLLIGLISGTALGVLLPLSAAAAGLLSWPGGENSNPQLMWRSAFAGIAVVLATKLAAWRSGERIRFRTVLSAATGGLVGMPIASAAASWSQLYGGAAGPLEAIAWVAAGVLIGTGLSTTILDRAPRAVKLECGVFLPDRACVEWDQLDSHRVRNRHASVADVIRDNANV